jgi:hypothetical protein
MTTAVLVAGLLASISTYAMLNGCGAVDLQHGNSQFTIGEEKL